MVPNRMVVGTILKEARWVPSCSRITCAPNRPLTIQLPYTNPKAVQGIQTVKHAAIIIDTAPSVTEADLDEAVKVIGLLIPVELRRLYLAANGGHPTPNALLKDDEVYCVHQFIPVKHGRKGEFLEDVVRMSRGYLPDAFIPIAIDAGGDHFLYSVAADSIGSVWFFASDYIDEPDRTMVKLADSLGDFMNGLVNPSGM
jgi:hypothetical protein